jgi:hypothetical protein
VFFLFFGLTATTDIVAIVYMLVLLQPSRYLCVFGRIVFAGFGVIDEI